VSHPRDGKYLGECTLRIQTDGCVEARLQGTEVNGTGLGSCPLDSVYY